MSKFKSSYANVENKYHLTNRTEDYCFMPCQTRVFYFDSPSVTNDDVFVKPSNIKGQTTKLTIGCPKNTRNI